MTWDWIVVCYWTLIALTEFCIIKIEQCTYDGGLLTPLTENWSINNYTILFSIFHVFKMESSTVGADTRALSTIGTIVEIVAMHQKLYPRFFCITKKVCPTNMQNGWKQVILGFWTHRKLIININ